MQTFGHQTQPNQQANPPETAPHSASMRRSLQGGLKSEADRAVLDAREFLQPSPGLSIPDEPKLVMLRLQSEIQHPLQGIAEGQQLLRPIRDEAAALGFPQEFRSVPCSRCDITSFRRVTLFTFDFFD